MTNKPTIDDLLDEIENMVRCYRYDIVVDDDSSLQCDDMIIGVFRKLYPERFKKAVELADQEIIEEGFGNLLDGVEHNLKLESMEDPYD